MENSNKKDGNVSSPKEKAKKNKWKKVGIIAGITIIIVTVILIPLFLNHVDKDQMIQSLPAEKQVMTKDNNITYVSWGFVSGMTVTTKLSATKVEKIYRLGIAGSVKEANSGLSQFLVNSVIWVPSLLNGAKLTIALTVTSVITGIFLSIFLALGKISKVPVLKQFCDGYIFFFRGTPLLMQLYFIYYGLPQISPNLAIESRFVTAYIAFTLNSAAYCSEIIRAAIQSIDKGQFEAAKALGMNYSMTMSKIIIPQSFRRLIPPVANEFIMVLKDASLVSIIALADLTKITTSICSSSASAAVFVPAMIIYLIITYVFTKIFELLEKKFSIYE